MRTLLYAIAAVLCCVFLAFVWPTRYRYEVASLHYFKEGRMLVRVDRFTGAADALFQGGWSRLEPTQER